VGRFGDLIKKNDSVSGVEHKNNTVSVSKYCTPISC